MPDIPNVNNLSFKGNLIPYNRGNESKSSISDSNDIRQAPNENINHDKEYNAIVAKYGVNIKKYKGQNEELKQKFYSETYKTMGYKFDSDESFDNAFNLLYEKYKDYGAQLQGRISDDLVKFAPHIPPEQIMARLNSGKFEYIGVDFQNLEFNDVDLSKYTEAFKYVNFNEKTFAKVSSEHLPEGFNPQEIFEKGKTIGLGIDEVHKMGYTGEGVSYAIIDSGTLDTDGNQHNDIHFKEYNVSKYADKSEIDHFHGRATSYIAQEIAPNADCYYFAVQNGKNMNAPVLDSLKSILEKNKSLPDNKKIRFVSMSMPLYGGEEAKKVVKELEAQGVWVYYSGCPEDSQRGYLEKINPNGDQNDFDNYQIRAGSENMIYVNAGDRTVPDSTSPTAYRHDSMASQSWSIPVIAGYYVLACQADQKMTPKKFMELANKTAQVKESTKPIRVGEGDNSIQVGRTTEKVPIKIIDIKALLQAIEKAK